MIDFDMMKFKQNLGNSLTRRVSVQHGIETLPVVSNHPIVPSGMQRIQWRINGLTVQGRIGHIWIA